jgi:hypothetical protein
MPTPSRSTLIAARDYFAEMLIEPKNGLAYLPLFERLEKEIEAIKARENTVDRARRLIAEREAQAAA